MSIELIKKVSTRRDINNFIRLPYGIYWGKKDRIEYWVPPLDMDVKHLLDRKKNPMYDHVEGEFWIAMDNGKPVGRIAAFIDQRYIDFQKTQTGFFGLFECYNRTDVSKVLYETAEEWLRERGMKNCIGPVNGSTNYQIGNQIDSFDELPVIEMPYAAPFYGELIEASDYIKAQDLYSYRKNVQIHALSEKILRLSELLAKRNGIVIRQVNIGDWDYELEIIKDMWNNAWKDNWGFTPWYDPEFYELAKNLKIALIPEMTYIAEIEGKPVGFCLPIPDVNFAFQKIKGKLFPFGIFQLLTAKKKAKILRIAAFGVVKEYQNKGVDGVMAAKIYNEGLKYGMLDTGEFSWILENNYSLRNMLENWDCEHYRTHRVYKKTL